MRNQQAPRPLSWQGLGADSPEFELSNLGHTSPPSTPLASSLHRVRSLESQVAKLGRGIAVAPPWMASLPTLPVLLLASGSAVPQSRAQVPNPAKQWTSALPGSALLVAPGVSGSSARAAPQTSQACAHREEAEVGLHAHRTPAPIPGGGHCAAARPPAQSSLQPNRLHRGLPRFCVHHHPLPVAMATIPRLELSVQFCYYSKPLETCGENLVGARAPRGKEGRSPLLQGAVLPSLAPGALETETPNAPGR